MTATPTLKLGLIGDNIARSRAPVLHRLAGAQHGIEVQYDRLIPAELGQDFEAVFVGCPEQGYRGINVTYPYKERAAARVSVADPLVRAIGAVNTVLFEPGGAQGQNTDYTGFIAAYRAARGAEGPGAAALIGSGGVGRAIAFALIALEAPAIRLADRDAGKAERLAAELRAVGDGIEVTTHATAEEAAEGAAGLVNATPLGMVGHEGTPLQAAAMDGAAWAFDAVYTPVDTQFLQDAGAAGLAVISGYELFFHQGVHAWAHFAGKPLDEKALRASLAEDEE